MMFTEPFSCYKLFNIASMYITVDFQIKLESIETLLHYILQIAGAKIKINA